MPGSRDDFTKTVVLDIARKAGWLCAFPGCRIATVGATEDGKGVINIGTAAHICAAAPGGPRYDETMAREERGAADNGIWMCRDHGKAIDSDPVHFTVERLRGWKRDAEQDAWRRVLEKKPLADGPSSAVEPSTKRFRDAAAADIAAFRNRPKWPQMQVALTLKIEGLEELADPAALASAALKLGDLILVAPPGMGKTTTLLQLAGAILDQPRGIALVLLLGDWATRTDSLVQAILARSAFHGFDERDFHLAARDRDIVLLLDGWNELDPRSRERARVEIETLKAELPGLAIVVSSRKQFLDLPFRGKRVDLLPLDEDQQLAIAKAIKGDAGAALLDRAWRTAGIADLVSIPLYLTVLLSLPAAESFPSTREELLGRFIAAHESEPRRAEAMHGLVEGLQRDYLAGLAAAATGQGHNGLDLAAARRCVSDVARSLLDEGQIAAAPAPREILDLFVDNHILIREGDGLAFQHQQFQEYYAAALAERLMCGGGRASDPALASLLDQPAWEEAIYFAVERLARGDAASEAACGAAIETAFKVDPMLAAAMIARSGDGVWARIAPAMIERLRGWHKPGAADRAQRFMMISGRCEFIDLLWPMLGAEDHQTSLKAIRNAPHLQASVLGPDAKARIAGVPPSVRHTIVSELAYSGGIEELDLALAVALDDDDIEVKAGAAGAMLFRRADRHLEALLDEADDTLFDSLVGNAMLDDIPVASIQARLAAARARRNAEEIPPFERMRMLLLAPPEHGNDAIADFIAGLAIKELDSAPGNLLYSLAEAYPDAVARGLLERVRQDRRLPYGASGILARAGFRIEEEALTRIILTLPGRTNDRAEAAASVLGPEAAAQLVDALLLRAGERRPGGRLDQAATDRFYELRARMMHVPAASLLDAVERRAGDADHGALAEMADLLAHRPFDEAHGQLAYDASDRARLFDIAESWGARLLASPETTRYRLTRIAALVLRVPDDRLAPLLKSLLDRNLAAYRQARAECERLGWPQGPLRDEASQPMLTEYIRAFRAIEGQAARAILYGYLGDPLFGEHAAAILAGYWQARHESATDRLFPARFDFSRAMVRRKANLAAPDRTSEEADAILAAAESLVSEGSEEARMRALRLAIPAAALPHGQRGALLEALLDSAPLRERAALLSNLVRSGAVIAMDRVEAGISEVLRESEQKRHLLIEDYHFNDWFRLLPFTDRPSDARAILNALPAILRTPERLEDYMHRLAEAGGPRSEELLFGLAEDDPDFYKSAYWRRTLFDLASPTALQRLINLVASGTIVSPDRSDRNWSREIAAQLDAHPGLRASLYAEIGRDESRVPPRILLRAVAENCDAEGLLLLVDVEIRHPVRCAEWPAVERAVTERRPVDDWQGAHRILPRPAPTLRKALFARITTGAADDPAARCLNIIDALRDEYGIAAGETRHPDLASGWPWPAITPRSPLENAEAPA